MSHPPAFGLTPADLAIETGGRGSRIDVSSPFRGSLQGLGIVWSLRPHLNCRGWGRLPLRSREFTWGEDPSPGEGRRPH